MSIIKIDKHLANYATIDKTCFEDKTLSWRATGLHSYLMGLPKDWSINVVDLTKRKTDGKVSVYSAIKELEEHGYMVKNAARGQDGRISSWNYIVYETPMLSATLSTNRLPTSGQTTSGQTTSGQTATTKYTEDTTKDTQDINKNTSTNSPKTEDKPFSQEEKRLKAVQDVFAGNENSSLAEQSGESWSRVVAAMWKERYGGSIQGWTLKFIKPLVKEHGLDTVSKALKTYFDQQEPKFISLKSFAEKFGFWASGGIKTKKRSEDFI